MKSSLAIPSNKLEPDEFVVMKGHVDYSAEILAEAKGISQIALDVSLQHHERMDGTGYPLGLNADTLG